MLEGSVPFLPILLMVLPILLPLLLLLLLLLLLRLGSGMGSATTTASRQKPSDSWSMLDKETLISVDFQLAGERCGYEGALSRKTWRCEVP